MDSNVENPTELCETNNLNSRYSIRNDAEEAA